MNKSPEIPERELREESLIVRHIAERRRPNDPDLAADWALKRDLSQLADGALPTRLRQRVMAAVRPPPRAPWMLAAAAAMAGLALVVGVIRQSPAPEPDLAELRLAVTTISDTSRRAMRLAGQKLPRNLDMPDFGLDELPYADAVRSALQARSNTPDPTHNEENHT